MSKSKPKSIKNPSPATPKTTIPAPVVIADAMDRLERLGDRIGGAAGVLLLLERVDIVTGVEIDSDAVLASVRALLGEARREAAGIRYALGEITCSGNGDLIEKGGAE